MASKPNISANTLVPWDEYKDARPDDALKSIYARIEETSRMMCSWYWTSIQLKRWTSLSVISLSFLLLIGGSLLPLFSAIQTSFESRLAYSQWGLAMLACAGLVQVADRVFGWSSGWMRYIVTVTTMENITREFELNWAHHIASKDFYDTSDVLTLLLLAQELELALTKLQMNETLKWATEFSSSILLLESLIRIQSQEIKTEVKSLRTSATNPESSVISTVSTALPGAIEITFVFKSLMPEKIMIALDSDDLVDYCGFSWSKLGISPGQHIVVIKTISDPVFTYQRVIEVQSLKTAKMEIQLMPLSS